MDEKTRTPAKIDLGIPENFLHVRHDVLRYADMDGNGHLNNVKFFEFCQESRMALFRAAGADDGEDGRAWLIVSLAISFLGQVKAPGIVDTGTVVLKFGNTSLQLGQGMFNDGRCVATAEMTMVRADQASGKPVPIEPAVRERLNLLGGHG